MSEEKTHIKGGKLRTKTFLLKEKLIKKVNVTQLHKLSFKQIESWKDNYQRLITLTKQEKDKLEQHKRTLQANESNLKNTLRNIKILKEQIKDNTSKRDALRKELDELNTNKIPNISKPKILVGEIEKLDGMIGEKEKALTKNLNIKQEQTEAIKNLKKLISDTEKIEKKEVKIEKKKAKLPNILLNLIDLDKDPPIPSHKEILEWDILGFSIEETLENKIRGMNPFKAKKNKIESLKSKDVAIGQLVYLDYFDLDGDIEIWYSKDENTIKWMDWENNKTSLLPNSYNDIKKTHNYLGCVNSYNLSKIYNSFQKWKIKDEEIYGFLDKKGIIREKMTIGDIIAIKDNNIAFIIAKEGFNMINLN